MRVGRTGNILDMEAESINRSYLYLERKGCLSKNCTLPANRTVILIEERREEILGIP